LQKAIIAIQVSVSCWFSKVCDTVHTIRIVSGYLRPGAMVVWPIFIISTDYSVVRKYQ